MALSAGRGHACRSGALALAARCHPVRRGRRPGRRKRSRGRHEQLAPGPHAVAAGGAATVVQGRLQFRGGGTHRDRFQDVSPGWQWLQLTKPRRPTPDDGGVPMSAPVVPPMDPPVPMPARVATMGPAAMRRLALPMNPSALDTSVYFAMSLVWIWRRPSHPGIPRTVPVLPPRRCAYCRVKLIVTVMRTGTGTPFSRVGVYSHCRTASSAA